MPMINRYGDVSNPLATFAMMLLTVKVRLLEMMMLKRLILSYKDLLPTTRHHDRAWTDDDIKTNLATLLKQRRFECVWSL